MRSRWTNFSAMAAAAIFFTATASFAADENALGNQNYIKGNYATAKVHFLKAIAANPQRWEAHYQLGNTYLQLKNKAGAKKCYIRCLSLNPSADIKLQCERAVGYLSGLPLAPTPAPIYAPAPRAQQTVPSYLTPNENSSSKTDAEMQKEANRARIMREAEAEIAKMKEEENARWKEILSQSNRFYKADGTRRREDKMEDSTQFFKDVAAKEQAIRDRAQRNCDAIR